MPDTLIVSARECLDPYNPERIDYKKVVQLLEDLELIKMVTVLGESVWGRYYLKAPTIRKAYYKRKNKQ